MLISADLGLDKYIHVNANRMILGLKMKPERINSLTGLRACTMLTVFCSHLSYLDETPFQGLYSYISNGRFGVNFFLVLSGFVIALGYSNKLDANNRILDISFVKKRISKIYLPYLITLLLAIPLYIINAEHGEGLNVKLLISRLIINISMIQSIIPFAKYSFSINAVSWFISTIFIIYLLTPGIIRLNNKAAKHYTLLKLVFLIFVLLFIHCCIYMVIGQIEYVRFADRNLSIIYKSPLIRIFPFLLGTVVNNIYCLLGNSRIKNGSFAELLGIVVFFLWWIIAYNTGFPTVVTECIDMLVSMFVILIFVFSDKGIVSRLLSKKRMLHLGNISLEFYLIHYLIIQYGIIAAKYFGLNHGITVLPLTILYFTISVRGAYLIHLLSIRKTL